MNRSEIKEACMAWLETLWLGTREWERANFKDLDEDDLISYHHTLCRDMRNENKLWSHSETIGCPDDFSMEVLINFWREQNGI